MKPEEKDSKEQTTTSAGAGRPSNGETPTPAKKARSASFEEKQTRYVNLRVRLRSLAYAIQQTERLHREVRDCDHVRLVYERADVLSAEERGRLITLVEDPCDEKAIALGSWEAVVSSLVLALCPKSWAALGKLTWTWEDAETAENLDPDQELALEAVIPSDFMPFWSRETLESHLTQLDEDDWWLEMMPWELGLP